MNGGATVVENNLKGLGLWMGNFHNFYSEHVKFQVPLRSVKKYNGFIFLYT